VLFYNGGQQDKVNCWEKSLGKVLNKIMLSLSNWKLLNFAVECNLAQSQKANSDWLDLWPDS
jgi:hypothetical protein